MKGNNTFGLITESSLPYFPVLTEKKKNLKDGNQFCHFFCVILTSCEIAAPFLDFEIMPESALKTVSIGQLHSHVFFRNVFKSLNCKRRFNTKSVFKSLVSRLESNYRITVQCIFIRSWFFSLPAFRIVTNFWGGLTQHCNKL